MKIELTTEQVLRAYMAIDRDRRTWRTPEMQQPLNEILDILSIAAFNARNEDADQIIADSIIADAKND